MTSLPAPSLSRADAMAAFLERAGYEGELRPLAGDASFRRYLRVLRGGQSHMLMDAPPGKEDVRPYLAVAKHLTACGYSAPHILAEDASQGFLLLEDLGDALFTPLLAPPAQANETELYRAAIALLADWHAHPAMRRAAQSVALPAYDHALLMQEVSLLPDWFLPFAAGKAEAERLRGEYMALWDALLRRLPPEQNLFVHRDFHASNLLWLPKRQGHRKIGLLDFQDAVWGDAAYDLVSLLEDARRDVSFALAQDMLEEYARLTGADPAALSTRYALLGAQRNAKIIGIFARLYLRDGKPHYLPLLPRVWGYFTQDLAHPALAELQAWVERHIPSAWREKASADG